MSQNLQGPFQSTGCTQFTTPSKRILDAQRLAAPNTDLLHELNMLTRDVDMYFDISEHGRSTEFVSLHSHCFWELVYCCCGSVEYLLGTQRYRVQAHDLIVIPPDVSHQPLFSEYLDPPYRRMVLWMNPDIPALASLDWSEVIRRGGTLVHTANTQWSVLESWFRRGCREAEHERLEREAFLLGNALCISAFVHRAISECDVVDSSAKCGELLDSIIAYVEAHLTEKITLTETARFFGMSKSTINKLLRARMDVSFYHYVLQRRLLLAKILIRENVPLTEIHQRTGFGDYTAFYRAFKQEYDLSPSQYQALFPPHLARSGLIGSSRKGSVSP